MNYRFKIQLLQFLVGCGCFTKNSGWFFSSCACHAKTPKCLGANKNHVERIEIFSFLLHTNIRQYGFIKLNVGLDFSIPSIFFLQLNSFNCKNVQNFGNLEETMQLSTYYLSISDFMVKRNFEKIFWSILLGNTKLLMVVKRSIITTTIFNAKNHKKCIKILNIPAISHCKKKPMQNFFYQEATMRSEKSSQIFTIGANKYSSDILHIGSYFPAGVEF